MRVTSARRSATSPDPRETGTHVVLVAQSGDDGNGAVVDALLELTGGAVELVVGADADAMPTSGRQRFGVHALPDLVSGSGRAPDAAKRELDSLLQGARHCSVIAPDVLEDAAGRASVVRSIAIAQTAARLGIDSRVIGFSWGADVRNGAVRTVRAAGRAGVQLFARDDLSHMRAMNDGITGLRMSADLGFATSTAEASVLDGIDAEGRPLGVLEVRASLTPGSDPTVEYLAIAMRLQRRGLHVVLLPSSPSSDADHAVCARIEDALDREAVTVLRRRLTAGQLRALAAAAKVGISDRSRFAVLALSSGTPVIALAAHPEVESLMRATGQSLLCIGPKAGFAFEVHRALDTVLADETGLRSRIRRMLPELAVLGRANLVGLPGVADPPEGSQR